MFVIEHKKIFFALSGLLFLASIVFMFVFGLRFGIDFTGGSLTEVRFLGDRPELSSLQEKVAPMNLETVQIQPIGDRGVLVRSRALSEFEHVRLLELLGGEETLTEERFASIGPTLGAELRRKAYIAITIVVLLTLLYIAFAFRKVGKEVSPWIYGVVVIVAMLHDVVIPIGVFAILGYFFGGFQIDALFVTALLAVMGYSINDTIVVFDRTRENVALFSGKEPFETIVGKSLRQTVSRSLLTSMTTLFVLLALYLLGSTSTREFVLVLMLGILVGTYSSIFVASPLLVTIKNWRGHRKFSGS